MRNLKIVLVVGLMQCFCRSLSAGEVSKTQLAQFKTEADFIVRSRVVAKNPGAYTFTSGKLNVNAWLQCGNFEPFSRRLKVHPVADSANEIILSTTRMDGYDSRANGWFDGAKVRVYRIVDGKLNKIREDKIKASYFEDWFGGVEGIRANQLVKPDILTAQSSLAPWSKHDCNYFYAVRAVNKNGVESKNSNYVKVFIPVAIAKKKPKLKNAVFNYRAPRNVKEKKQPDAPTGFAGSLAETTGIITFSWQKSPAADIVGYRIVMSYYKPDKMRGYHLYLENKPADPHLFVKKNDLVFIDKATLTFAKSKDLSRRVYDAGQNNISQPYFTNNENANWRLVKHPGKIPQKLQVEGGQTCIQIERKSEKEVILAKYNHSSLAQNWYRVLDPEKTYIVEFWAKQKDLGSSAVIFDLAGPLSSEVQPIKFELTADWQQFRGEWSIKTLLKKGKGIGQMRLTIAGGPGTIWLDNWRVYEKGTAWMDLPAADYQEMRKSGMAFFRCHDQIKTFYGYSMEGLTNTAGSIEWRYTRPGPGSFNTLPNQLNMMKKGGVNPWLQIEMCMSEKEWLGFVEYFCAPYDPAKDNKTTKPWAYKRFIQGHLKPYLADFSRVLFEISNETWNSLFMPFGFSGVSMNDEKNNRIYSGGEVYGVFQEYVIGILRSSPYWTDKVEKKFEFVLGGWAIQDKKEGYGPAAGKMSPSSNYMTVASYNGGWDEKVSPAKAGPKGFFDALTIAPRLHMPRAQRFIALKKEMGANYSLGTYEGGPGYNLNGLNGVRMTPEMVEQENMTMKSLAAGTATLDVFLSQSALGYKLQNFFTFNRNRNYWTSHARMSNGGQAYPSWKALALYNNHGLGDFLAVQAVKISSWDLIAKKRSRRKTVKGLPLISVYATQLKDKLNLFVLSRKVRNYPVAEDMGFTPVHITLPIVKAEKLTLYRMTGNPEDHNLDSDKVKIEEIELDASLAKQSFTVNEMTGADAQGIPPASTFLYVFSGCEKSLVKDKTIVTTAVGQPKLAAKGPVNFAILLPDSKKIKEDDFKVSGTSGVSSANSIEIVPGSEGTAYNVEVNGMLKSGTVVLEYDKQKITVDFKIPVGESLVMASWYLPAAPRTEKKYAPSAKDLVARNCMPIIKRPRIVLGKDYKLSLNKYYNNYGLATMRGQWSLIKKDSPDSYISWLVEPLNDAHMSLDQLIIGLWSVGGDSTFKLFWSLDGFKTFNELPLKTKRPVSGCRYSQGSGIPATVDLSAVKKMQDISTTLEFRLHAWGGGPKGIGKLGKRRGEDLPDLVIKGKLKD